MPAESQALPFSPSVCLSPKPFSSRCLCEIAALLVIAIIVVGHGNAQATNGIPPEL